MRHAPGCGLGYRLQCQQGAGITGQSVLLLRDPLLHRQGFLLHVADGLLQLHPFQQAIPRGVSSGTSSHASFYFLIKFVVRRRRDFLHKFAHLQEHLARLVLLTSALQRQSVKSRQSVICRKPLSL